MKPARRSILLGVAAILFGSLASAEPAADAGFASPETLDRWLGQIARARASLKTLSGPFTQTRKIGLLAAKVVSKGTVTLVRPDRLRWELLPPDNVTYWVTPEGLAYKSPEGQGRVQGASAKVALALDDVRILLGGDLALLRGRYDLQASGADDGPVTFVATPKDSASALQRLVFTLGPDRVRPLSATIVEGPRDQTDIAFGALVKDAPIDPSRMALPSSR